MIFKDIIKKIIDDNISDEEKILNIKNLFSDKTYPEEFKIFWNTYGNILGVKKGRGDIYNIYNKRINGGDNPLDILRGLKEYSKGAKAGFIIGPRRFLNSSVWKDYLSLDLVEARQFYVCGYGKKHMLTEICGCE